MDIAWRFRIMLFTALALILFGDLFGYGSVRGVKSDPSRPPTGSNKFQQKNAEIEINEGTYRSRNKRDTAMLAYNADIAQKEILREFGPRACVLVEPCRVHASRPGHYSNTRPNWPQVFSNYKVQSTGTKQWYLLSVFIGDAVRDVPLCRLLAKRMPCPNVGPLPPPQPR